MEQRLMQELHDYMRDNNPDVLIDLQTKRGVTQYLQEKVGQIGNFVQELVNKDLPAYAVAEICLPLLTADLRPSKYNLICAVLSEDFENDYCQMVNAGTLLFEALNMLSACQPIFNAFDLTEETIDNRHLHYAIAGQIQEYLRRPLPPTGSVEIEAVWHTMNLKN